MAGLVALRPRVRQLHVSRGRTVLVSGLDGFVTSPEHGLFVHETRVASRYRWTLDGRAPFDVAVSSVEQHTALGYYIADPGSEDDRTAAAQHTIELRLTRTVGNGLHEEVDLTNFSGAPASFELLLEIDADLVDAGALPDPPRADAPVDACWDARGELTLVRREVHAYEHQGDRGVASTERALVVRVRHADSPPIRRAGMIGFAVALAARATWHACLDAGARIDGATLMPAVSCGAPAGLPTAPDPAASALLRHATRVVIPSAHPLATTADAALERAKRDLLALHLDDLDDGNGWTVAGGVPGYVALFGRDTLLAGAAAGLVGPELMEGALRVLAERQGTRDDPWRDERPGRMLHEAHTGPRAALRCTPQARYYGSATASALYPAVVACLWRWSGDPGHVRRYVEPARRALAWLDTFARRDGLYWYRTRSEQGLRNQGWKDSGDAIVHEDGTQAMTPIATCETQAYVYASKRGLSDLLWWLGEREEAQCLWSEADALGRRFDQTFWMEDHGFFAMGLDGDGRLIRSIASDPGHCLATGIVTSARARRTADRLLESDLFSGWGVRTLSAAHPAFDPHSYHRGSVWPVDQGALVHGFARYGFHEHAERLCRAQLEAAALFLGDRLPEVFAGHPRDRAHPFPAIYVQANAPQAWSASAVLQMIEGMLGLLPYAPLHALFVDPHLPAWLPALTLTGIRVGEATATLHFSRTDDGRTACEVVARDGNLVIVEHAAPWMLLDAPPDAVAETLGRLVGCAGAT